MPYATPLLNHFGFNVPKDKFDEVLAWYLAALAPLKYEKLAEYPNVVGIGANQNPDVWIVSDENATGAGHFHMAFRAPDHATVDAFHAAALKAGGSCNGPPGLRKHYHESYYAAYVRDPLGNNIELVDHDASHV